MHLGSRKTLSVEAEARRVVERCEYCLAQGVEETLNQEISLTFAFHTLYQRGKQSSQPSLMSSALDNVSANDGPLNSVIAGRKRIH